MGTLGAHSLILSSCSLFRNAQENETTSMSLSTTSAPECPTLTSSLTTRLQWLASQHSSEKSNEQTACPTKKPSKTYITGNKVSSILWRYPQTDAQYSGTGTSTETPASPPWQTTWLPPAGPTWRPAENTLT